MPRITRTAALLGSLLFTLTWVNTAEPQSKGRFGNADAITEDELKVYEYFLASDQLEGRNAPSRGYDTAALYVASHLSQWGLKPGGSTTGTNGPLQPYFMPIELVSNQLDAAGMKLTLVSPAPAAGAGGFGGGGGGGGQAVAAGPRTFEYSRDWMIGAGGGFGAGIGGGGGRGDAAAAPADLAGAPLVFVGPGYVINKTNTNPYQGIDVRGKVIVVAGVPPEMAAAQAAAAAAARGGAAAGAGAAAGGRGGRDGAPVNPLGVENTDYTTPQGYAAKNGALGIIMIPTFQQLTALSNPVGGGRGVGPNGPPFQVVSFQTASAAVPVITAGVQLTNAIFQGEKLSGAQVFEGAAANAKLESFGLNAEKKLSLQIKVASERGHTENVIAMLEGSDPVLKNEYVVLSAHLDHTGLGAGDATGDTVFNGADDDASGSCGLLAVAHAYAQGAAKGMRPKRTMIFLWVAGEEKGLWGSRYFNQFPPVDITKVVANVNMDMIGRTKTPGYVDPPSYKLVAPGEILVVGPNISSDDLGKTLETVNNSYQKLKLDHFYDVTAPDATHDNLGPSAAGQRIFYRSDHYSFAKMGIPTAFFTSGLHPDYHRLSDTPDKIDYVAMAAVSKTVAAVSWAVANAATRPKLNAKLPDLLVNDMKAAQADGWGKLTPVPPPLPKMPF
ncbi:MAG: M28 family peptidase [Acidobacteriota bacterium]